MGRVRKELHEGGDLSREWQEIRIAKKVSFIGTVQR